ncbi:hypothetical protein KIW84_021595 [Lathyrus oleraceus]|uniref:Uncharacterized protein n=1 Tax=Pisum sativum TaxID=3888 RepID=A0A9D4YCT5_PEA|nr:hypothetical protein KIW84_021595 [Pisum sativum]
MGGGGDNSRSKKDNAIKWDVDTSSKSDDGLRLCKLDIINKACISKLVWKLQNNNGEFWCDGVWGDKDVNVWNGVWIAPNARISELQFFIPMHIQNANVDDIANEDAGWNWDDLNNWPPMDILQRIVAIMLASFDACPDVRVGFWHNGI